MIVLRNIFEDSIKNEGEKAYPNECCGIIFGLLDENGKKTARLVEAIQNSHSANEQYHRFLITAEEMMKAEWKARKLDLEILGFYHSHPDHPAKPSEFDREHAFPFYSYVIVSVTGGKAIDLTSWVLTEDRLRFMTEDIVKEQDR